MLTTIALLLLACLTSIAQLTEDFSDGDFTDDPVWYGNTEDFVVEAGELRLNATSAGRSTLTTDVTFPDSVVWEFYYRMDFAPSSSNALRVYLMLDTTATGVANGYFLEIGESGGDDALYFYALEDGSAELLVFSAGIFGGDPSTAGIRITRQSTGDWEFGADLENSGNYAFLMAVNDGTIAPAAMRHFSLECTYSETRRDRFYFDNISIAPVIPDTFAPQIVNVTAISSTQLGITYDEPIHPDDALNTGLYTIDHAIGSPDFVSMPSPHEVVLALHTMLESGVEYTLEVENMRDTAGNVQMLESRQFTYFEIATPAPYDVLITEIMADPSPAVGLPDAEYVEIHNRSGRTFDLAGMILRAGSSEAEFDSHILAPGAHVAVVDVDDAGLFHAFPHVVNVSSLPSLVNSGTTLSLETASGLLLHEVSYTDGWYGDAAKDDGGWSLELISPEAPCTLADNWTASVDLRGGTPGEQNSVHDVSGADDDGPVLLSLFPVSDTEIRLTFNEILGTGSPDISIDPVVDISQIIVSGTGLQVVFAGALTGGTLYTLHIADVKDCLGNAGSPQSQTFALPQQAGAGDLLINELLFDPVTGGSRYVELYNFSNKYIATDDLVIAEIIGGSTNARAVTERFLIYPDTYVAVTPDPQGTAAQYPRHDPARLIMSELPAFDRRSGNVTVYTVSGVVLDSFDYTEDLHNSLLDETQGVSLERVSIHAATNSAASWQSAAATAGFGTPGLPNSQQIDLATAGEFYAIENPTFSPDGDGFEDFLAIQFTHPPIGSVATIRVFDANGRELAKPLSNALVGANSLATWDGTTDDGLRAPLGIYILLLEIVGDDGTVHTFKEPAVLAARL